MGVLHRGVLEGSKENEEVAASQSARRWPTSPKEKRKREKYSSVWLDREMPNALVKGCWIVGAIERPASSAHAPESQSDRACRIALCASTRMNCRDLESHNLILCQTAVHIGIHAVPSTRCDVLDEAETERAPTVLVTLEFSDGSLRGIGRIKSNNSSPAGSAARFVLDLGLLNLSDGGEEFNQVVVASRPRQLVAS